MSPHLSKACRGFLVAQKVINKPAMSWAWNAVTTPASGARSISLINCVIKWASVTLWSYWNYHATSTANSLIDTEGNGAGGLHVHSLALIQIAAALQDLDIRRVGGTANQLLRQKTYRYPYSYHSIRLYIVSKLENKYKCLGNRLNMNSSPLWNHLVRLPPRRRPTTRHPMRCGERPCE